MARLIALPFWLLIWACSSWLFDLRAALLPDFFQVAVAIVGLLSNAEFYEHVLTTFTRLIPGLIVSIVTGIPVGLALAQSPIARSLIEPLFTLVRGIPVASLFPVAILLFGIDDGARAALTVYVVFPIVVTSTVSGAVQRPDNQTRRDYLRLHRNTLHWTDTPLCLLWDAFPATIGGVRVSIGLALVVMIVSEMFFVGGSGVGWYTWDQYQSFNFGNMYASILIIGAISVFLDYLLAAGLRVADRGRG